jgi:hypothetical protein
MMSPQSDSIAELAAALAEAQGAIEAPLKTKEAKIDGENKLGNKFEFKYRYAPLEEVTRVIREPLSKRGLSWRQGMVSEGDKIFVRTTIMHTSGEWFASDYPVHVAGPGSQKFGGGASYARRYGLTFALGIAAEEDDDANASEGHSAEIVSRPARAPVTRGVTRTASPTKPVPAPAVEAGNGHEPGREEWVDTFLARESYEIVPKKAGGWSAWENYYLAVCRHATDIDQITKLENDNGAHFSGFREAVRKEVYDHFRGVVQGEEKRLWRAPDTDFVNEMSGAA